MVKIQFSTLRADIILTKFNSHFFNISTDIIISSLKLFARVLNGSQLPTSTKISEYAKIGNRNSTYIIYYVCT